MLQRWRSAPDCKSGVVDLGGSNPSTPTMAVIFILIFAIGVWIALWASDERRDGLLIFGVTIACSAFLVAQYYYN